MDRNAAIHAAKDAYFLATRRGIFDTRASDKTPVSIYAIHQGHPDTNPRTAWRATVGLGWVVELSANGGTVKAWEQ